MQVKLVLLLFCVWGVLCAWVSLVGWFGVLCLGFFLVWVAVLIFALQGGSDMVSMPMIPRYARF